ncbi:MAG: hypothetical protein K0U52_06290 [Gammaproteobacteria bacterium]|nr:hypothetical protein [Gammaproteobacteria bacterium]
MDNTTPDGQRRAIYKLTHKHYVVNVTMAAFAFAFGFVAFAFTFYFLKETIKTDQKLLDIDTKLETLVDDPKDTKE